MKLQHVWWRDAHDGESGWHRIEDIDPADFINQSVGWRLPDSVKPGFVTLAATIAPHEQLGNYVHIPHVCVIRVIEWES